LHPLEKNSVRQTVYCLSLHDATCSESIASSGAERRGVLDPLPSTSIPTAWCCGWSRTATSPITWRRLELFDTRHLVMEPNPLKAWPAIPRVDCVFGGSNAQPRVVAESRGPASRSGPDRSAGRALPAYLAPARDRRHPGAPGFV